MAAEEVPSIQILNKENYFQQALVPFPNAIPYPPLGPSSLRLRTSVLSLTVNNFTYATLGTLLKWWDVHPLPAGTPAPYNDSSKYGRISAWGYAEVLESTVSAIPKGSFLWGYVPLGTLAQDLEVRMHDTIADQVFVTSAYRQHVMPIYNRYFVFPASSLSGEIASKTPALAHDAVLRVMHATAFLMADFVFSSDAARVVAPGLAASDEAANAAWSAKDGDLRDATVLIFAPGSKAAAIFASLLVRRSEAQGRPRKIIGVSSEVSRAFVEGTGIYDGVLLASAEHPAAAVPELAESKRVVVFDFGGRGGAGRRWAAALADRCGADKFLFAVVGSGIVDPAAAPQLLSGMGQIPPFPAARVNADDMRRRAMKAVGEERYWSEEAKSWEHFREQGVKGLSFTWGEGMEAVIEGWDRLASGKVLPSEGLVFKV
ncbi:hypothetical protein F4808DRAFT_411113 [Astrocystis sublimbata]|nr:hypothetical protein F4808DRAFT_411113 [Astrocystis sublimbata]